MRCRIRIDRFAALAVSQHWRMMGSERPKADSCYFGFIGVRCYFLLIRVRITLNR